MPHHTKHIDGVRGVARPAHSPGDLDAWQCALALWPAAHSCCGGRSLLCAVVMLNLCSGAFARSDSGALHKAAELKAPSAKRTSVRRGSAPKQVDLPSSPRKRRGRR